MKHILTNTLLSILFAIGCISCSQHQEADMVVFGKIWTGVDSQLFVEGMAIVGDSIVAVGARAEIERWSGSSTKRIETDEGTLVVPGFIDCHTHFVDGGFSLASVQLRDAKTKEEFIQRIADYAKELPKGQWITSGDWDHQNWGGELPTRDWIDSVTHDNPVWINRLDGHMCLANSATLEAAGIANNVNDVDGGTIVRDKLGRLTGVFKDNAMAMIYKKVPAPSEAEEDIALAKAMDYVLERGVTSVHNMSGFMETFNRARMNGALKVRVYAGMTLQNWKDLNTMINLNGRGDKWLRIGGLKEFVDGSLGSHTAAFFEPFTDTPSDSGFLVITEEELYRRIKAADSAGLQVMTHAIGDRAIHILLDIYQRVTEENGDRDRRFRIEHAQHIHPNDLRRFAELDVIPSMQPYHAIDDGRWAEKVIGYERCKTTYAFKSLLDAYGRLAFGSDWFVAPPTPLEGIYAAVTRRTLDDANPDGWVPEQKITVEQALRAYTINAAYASFEEQIKGSLEPGKLADFAILDHDILTIDAEKIRDVKVVKTVVGGKMVFERQ